MALKISQIQIELDKYLGTKSEIEKIITFKDGTASIRANTPDGKMVFVMDKNYKVQLTQMAK